MSDMQNDPNYELKNQKPEVEFELMVPLFFKKLNEEKKEE